MPNGLLKLSDNEHSGRLRGHEHTSYLPLAVLMLVVGIALTFYSVSVSAASPGPEASSIGLTGTLAGPPPSTPAVIQTPNNGQHFSTSPIKVSGTCPKNTVVELFKSDIFAGSANCDNGRFSLDLDLLFGKNVLVAKVFDALNQSGPDSSPVTVYYDVLTPQSGPLTTFDFKDSQLLLNTDALYRGLFPLKSFQVPVSILGGTPPYALNVQWGDANNNVIPRPDNQSFKISHIYQKAGTYQITLQASDAVGRQAFLGVAAIVNGQPEVLAATSEANSPANLLLLLWPVYTSAAAIVVSFWLGERREKHILAKHTQTPLLPTQG